MIENFEEAIDRRGKFGALLTEIYPHFCLMLTLLINLANVKVILSQ